jgi:hypothetical protein
LSLLETEVSLKKLTERGGAVGGTIMTPVGGPGFAVLT